MAKRITEELGEIAYVSIWLHLGGDPPGGSAAICRIVERAYTAAGLKKVSLTLFDYATDADHKANVVPVAGLGSYAGCQVVPYASMAMFHALRPGAADRIRDYLAFTDFHGINTQQPSHERVPMLDMTIRVALFEKQGERLVACVREALDAAAAELDIVSGLVDVAYGHETGFGTYYNGGTIVSEVSLERAINHQVWVHEKCDPTARLRRMGWITIVGPKLAKMLDPEGTMLGEYAEQSYEAPGRENFGWRLSDGTLCFGLTQDPFETLGPAIEAHRATSGENYLISAAWLFWRLREKDLIL